MEVRYAIFICSVPKVTMNNGHFFSFLLKMTSRILIRSFEINPDSKIALSKVILDAAVQALSEILYVEVEENTLDFNFYQTTFNGYLQPSLYSKLADDKDFKVWYFVIKIVLTYCEKKLF